MPLLCTLDNYVLYSPSNLLSSAFISVQYKLLLKCKLPLINPTLPPTPPQPSMNGINHRWRSQCLDIFKQMISYYVADKFNSSSYKFMSVFQLFSQFCFSKSPQLSITKWMSFQLQMTNQYVFSHIYSDNLITLHMISFYQLALLSNMSRLVSILWQDNS